MGRRLSPARSPTNPEMFDVRAVAAYLNMARVTIYRLINHPDPTQRLSMAKVGGTWRIHKSTVDAWLLERARRRRRRMTHVAL